MSLSYHKTIPVGIRYMVLSALGFALMTACVKKVSINNIPVLEIVAARSLISLLISFINVKRKNLSIWGNNKTLLLARGLAGAIALMCVYYAVATLPLAEATILQYLHPVFTALLALVFLKERIHTSTMICIALCLSGLVLMVEPGFVHAGAASLPWFSVSIALCGAFGSAVAYVIVRRLSQTEDSSVIIFYFPLVALPISVLLLGNDFVMPDLDVLLFMVLIGIFTQIGQVGLTKAMRTEAASRATAYSYIQVVFSITLGWLCFNEIPTLTTLIGGGLIIAGAMVNVFGSINTGQQKNTAS